MDRNSSFSRVGKNNWGFIKNNPNSNTQSSNQIEPIQSPPEYHFVSDEIDLAKKSVVEGPKDCLPRTAVSPLVRCLFKFEWFNKMQSTCFHALYRSDANSVIGAPTASGKTVCFELALARHFESFLSSQTSNSRPKAIYIAPLKSLVQERSADWKKKLRSLNMKCQELTGDSTEEESMLEGDLILTTPEKLESISRKWKDVSKTWGQVRLLMIDEVHLLGEDRGAILEAVVTRFKTIMVSSPPRLIALSASTPNVQDISMWLEAPNSSTFYFGEEHKPIKPELHVLGYKSSSDYQFENSLDWKLRGVISTYSQGKPTIIFCSSRKGVLSAVTRLLESCANSSSPFVRNTGQRERLFEAAKTVQSDTLLQNCILAGIGFHHAGMLPEHRHLVESLFSTGQDLLVIAATSTLATGLNLPAFLVIIKSTTQWTPQLGSQEYNPTMLRQMIGRAGRPQFGDNSAVAVIMTQEEKKSNYENILLGEMPTESSLHTKLADILSIEISLRNIENFKSALDFLQKTFLAIRITQNPDHYGFMEDKNKMRSNEFSNRSNRSIPNLHPFLRALCISTLSDLQKYETVQLFDEIMPTELGKSMTRFFISFESIKSFFDIFPSNQQNQNLNETNQQLNQFNHSNIGLSSILDCISRSPEFKDTIVRRLEKAELKALGSRCRIPYTKAIKKENKISILLQSLIGRFPIADASMKQEAPSLLLTSTSITQCLFQYFVNRRWFMASYKTLVLIKCLKKQIWENGNLTWQIPSLTPDLIQKMCEIGCNTLFELERTDVQTLSTTLNRVPAFAVNILERLQAIPKMRAVITISIKVKENIAQKSGKSFENQENAQQVQFENGPEANFYTKEITVYLQNLHSNQNARDDRFDYFWILIAQHDQILSCRHVSCIISNVSIGHPAATFQFEIPLSIVGELDFVLASENWIGFDIVGKFSCDSDETQCLEPDPSSQSPYVDEINMNKTSKKRNRSDIAKISTEKPEKLQNQTISLHDQVHFPDSKFDGEVDHEPKTKKSKAEEICKHKCKNKLSCKHQCCKDHPEVKTTSIGIQPISFVKNSLAPTKNSKLESIFKNFAANQSSIKRDGTNRSNEMPNTVVQNLQSRVHHPTTELQKSGLVFSHTTDPCGPFVSKPPESNNDETSNRKDIYAPQYASNMQLKENISQPTQMYLEQPKSPSSSQISTFRIPKLVPRNKNIEKKLIQHKGSIEFPFQPNNSSNTSQQPKETWTPRRVFPGDSLDDIIQPVKPSSNHHMPYNTYQIQNPKSNQFTEAKISTAKKTSNFPASNFSTPNRQTHLQHPQPKRVLQYTNNVVPSTALDFAALSNQSSSKQQSRVFQESVDPQQPENASYKPAALSTPRSNTNMQFKKIAPLDDGHSLHGHSSGTYELVSAPKSRFPSNWNHLLHWDPFHTEP